MGVKPILSNMNCLKCNGKVFMNGFCSQHFAENIEKRVKKDIRQNNLIEKGKILLAKDPITVHFIKNVLNVPVKIVGSGRHDKEILLWTMDDEILYFFTNMFKGKMRKESIQKNSIRLFRTVKDSELEAYAKLKGIRFSRKRAGQEKRILEELDKIEGKHKETRFSLIKSIEEISSL